MVRITRARCQPSTGSHTDPLHSVSYPLGTWVAVFCLVISDEYYVVISNYPVPILACCCYYYYNTIYLLPIRNIEWHAGCNSCNSRKNSATCVVSRQSRRRVTKGDNNKELLIRSCNKASSQAVFIIKVSSIDGLPVLCGGTLLYGTGSPFLPACPLNGYSYTSTTTNLTLTNTVPSSPVLSYNLTSYNIHTI